jgi:SAM-dependent methyltransferase
MAQRTTGIYSLLSSARLYQRLQDFLARPSSREAFARDYVRAKVGDRVLDIGCGTAHVLETLPDVQYFGFDPNEKYIARARERFGQRGSFWADRVDQATLARVPPCDLVLAIGVLHHLDDDEAARLFTLAHAALRAGGRLVTWDPGYTDDQSRLARLLIGLDRGRSVRRPEGYQALAARAFPQVRVSVRHDMLSIPWTHIILECER